MKYHRLARAVLLAALAAVSGMAVQAGKSQSSQQEHRIRISFDNDEIIVKLRNHAVTRDFLSRLPTALEFKDYIGKEKIAYLPSRLASDGTSPISRGDFACYAPWGNLAIFYNGDGRAGDGLIVLGNIESGKEHLAAMTVSFTAHLERID